MQVDILQSSETDLQLIESLRSVNKVLNAEIEELRQAKVDLEANVKSLGFYLTDAQTKMTQFNMAYADLSQRLVDQDSTVRMKQANIEDLSRRVAEERAYFEEQVQALNTEIAGLKTQKEELNNVLMNSSMHNLSHIDNDDASSSIYGGLTSALHGLASAAAGGANTSSSRMNSRAMTPVKNVTLEAQLNFCREKCESVMSKMANLKAQNDTLNRKIKSIKSLMN